MNGRHAIYANNLKIGDCYLQLEEYDRAIRSYTKAIGTGYERGCRLGRGRAYHKKGLYAKAIEDYEAARQEDPKAVQALAGLAEIYFQCPEESFCDADKALEVVRFAGKQSVKEHLPKSLVASIYAAAGDYNRAIGFQYQAFEKAIAKNKSDEAKTLCGYIVAGATPN